MIAGLFLALSLVFPASASQGEWIRDFKLPILHQKLLLASTAGVGDPLPIRAERERDSHGVEGASALPVDDIEPLVWGAPIIRAV